MWTKMSTTSDLSSNPILLKTVQCRDWVWKWTLVECEMKATLFWHANKAQDLTGFRPLFWNKLEHCSKNIIDMLQKISGTGLLLKEMNTAFISLIHTTQTSWNSRVILDVVTPLARLFLTLSKQNETSSG